MVMMGPGGVRLVAARGRSWPAPAIRVSADNRRSRQSTLLPGRSEEVYPRSEAQYGVSSRMPVKVSAKRVKLKHIIARST